MKKLITATLTACLVFGSATSALAVTPTYQPPKLPKIPKITVELPESTNKGIEKAAQEYLRKHPINVKINMDLIR